MVDLQAADVIGAVAALRNELLLFAAIGFIVGGLDDLLIDLVYISRRLWRQAFIYRLHAPMTSDRLPRSTRRGAMAVFIPAWDESAVIGSMLRRCLHLWRDEDVTVFVGVYPNDLATAQEVARAATGSDKVVLVVTPTAGPTTKADCLNALWHAMERVEQHSERPFKAVVLHDAEDVVHPDGLHVMSAMIDRFDFVQLPVLPLLNAKSRWIAAHYCDEFVESHCKGMIVREFFGASLPSAGVGCAFDRALLAAIAAERGGQPFDAVSLTEDYELGLQLARHGGRGVMVRMRDADGALVATREYFPDSLPAAVRQKARWMVGIALAGWDRLGWHGGVAERWMRLRDRRALIATLVLAVAYGALMLSAAVAGLAMFAGHPAPSVGTVLASLLVANAALLTWRIAIRATFVGRSYGWREGLRSIPRQVVANIIALMAARRALMLYVRLLRTGTVQWDKTVHRFPTDAEIVGR